MTLSDAQRSEIGEALFGLVGLPLAEVSGPPYRQRFDFVESRLRPPCQAFSGGRSFAAWDPLAGERPATWSLSALCEWRLQEPYAEPFTSKDVRSHRNAAPPRSESLERLTASRLLVVEDVMVRKDGALRLGFSESYVLVVLPRGEFNFNDEALRADLRWSLRSPEDDPRGDLFFRVGGLEWKPKIGNHQRFLIDAEAVDRS